MADDIRYEEIPESVYVEQTTGKGITADGKVVRTVDAEAPQLMLVDQGFITNNQALKIFQRTPPTHVHNRPAKGGGEWDYVTGTYVKKVLNYVFGWNWSFEVKAHGREQDSVWVLGKLTIHHPTDSSRSIIKEQFGRKDIAYKVEYQEKRGGDDRVVKTKVVTDKFLDYGNDLKAATTDALKKCAAEIGIASDVYAAEEFKEIKMEKPAKKEDKKENKQDSLEKLLATMKDVGIEVDKMTPEQCAAELSRITGKSYSELPKLTSECKLAEAMIRANKRK